MDFGKVFSATLMNLNLKKLIGFEVEKNIKGKDIIRISVKDNPQEEEILKDDERYIFEFIKEAIKSRKTESITVKELQTYISGHTSKITSLISRVQLAVTRFINNNDYVNKSDVKRQNMLMLSEFFPIFIAIFGFVFSFAMFEETMTFTPALLGIVIIYIVSTIIAIILSFISSNGSICNVFFELSPSFS